MLAPRSVAPCGMVIMVGPSLGPGAVLFSWALVPTPKDNCHEDFRESEVIHGVLTAWGSAPTSQCCKSQQLFAVCPPGRIRGRLKRRVSSKLTWRNKQDVLPARKTLCVCVCVVDCIFCANARLQIINTPCLLGLLGPSSRTPGWEPAVTG